MRRFRTNGFGAAYSAAILVSLLTLALWAASFRWVVSYVHSGSNPPIVEIRVGCIAIWTGFGDQADSRGFHLNPCEKNDVGVGGLRHDRWGFMSPHRVNWWRQHLYVIPLWLPWSAVTLLALILGLRRRRRPPPGHCDGCGYNLRGNVTGICPECGTPAG